MLFPVFTMLLLVLSTYPLSKIVPSYASGNDSNLVITNESTIPQIFPILSPSSQNGLPIKRENPEYRLFKTPNTQMALFLFCLLQVLLKGEEGTP
jgi:hypothetical protein